LAQELEQARAGAGDVFAEEEAGAARVALARGAQDRAMLVVGSAFAVGEGQLHTEIAVGLLVQSLRDAEGDGSVRGGVEGRVKRPVHLAPRGDVAIAKGLPVALEHFGGARDLRGVERGDGAPEERGLDVGAEREDLVDLIERERGNDGAAMWAEGHEPFRLELTQRLADRDAT